MIKERYDRMQNSRNGRLSLQKPSGLGRTSLNWSLLCLVANKVVSGIWGPYTIPMRSYKPIPSSLHSTPSHVWSWFIQILVSKMVPKTVKVKLTTFSEVERLELKDSWSITTVIDYSTDKLNRTHHSLLYNQLSILSMMHTETQVCRLPHVSVRPRSDLDTIKDGHVCLQR